VRRGSVVVAEPLQFLECSQDRADDGAAKGRISPINQCELERTHPVGVVDHCPWGDKEKADAQTRHKAGSDGRNTGHLENVPHHARNQNHADT